MPKRTPLETHQYYHVFNRGVAKQEIFFGDFDYARFIESMGVFNTSQNICIQYARESLGTRFPGSPGNLVPKPASTPLVKIHAFTLLPNHYHLVLQQLVENGIRDFMAKLNGGYSRYINKKYERVGPLYQSAFRANHLSSETDLIRATKYVHMNIFDLDFPEWRDGRISTKNKSKAIKALRDYEWSDCRSWIKNDSNYLDFLLGSWFPGLILLISIVSS